MSGQVGSSARRRLKKEKRQRLTLQEILEQVMTTLRANGYPVRFAEEIPDAMKAAFSGAQAQETPHPQVVYEVPFRLDVQVHMGDDNDQDLFDEIDEEFRVIDVPTGAPRSEPQKMLQDQGEIDQMMLDEFNRKQAALLERIEVQGVNYRNSPGPAQGARMAPHPSIAPTPASSPAPTAPPPTPGAPRAAVRGPAPPSDSSEIGGRINPHTGLSVEEQRKIMERVLGKRPTPPPPGVPNTLKP